VIDDEKRKTTSVSTLAPFAVQAGRPGPERT
jgi:hypothetical protein